MVYKQIKTPCSKRPNPKYRCTRCECFHVACNAHLYFPLSLSSNTCYMVGSTMWNLVWLLESNVKVMNHHSYIKVTHINENTSFMFQFIILFIKNTNKMGCGLSATFDQITLLTSGFSGWLDGDPHTAYIMIYPYRTALVLVSPGLRRAVVRVGGHFAGLSVHQARPVSPPVNPHQAPTDTSINHPHGQRLG